MSYSRRKFLGSLLRGAGGVVAALALPSEKLMATSNVSTSTPLNKEELRQLYAQAKELFYRKQYGSAAVIYQRLIALQPSAIEAYDGLTKVYNAQNQQVQIAALFREAVGANENNSLFYDRYAKSLTSLATGNYGQYQEYVKLYNEERNLFEVAALQYKKSITLSPSKQYLQLALLDLRSKLDNKNKIQEKQGDLPWTFSEATSSYMASIETNVGHKWEQTRKPFRKNITENPNQLVQRMAEKKRRTLYSQEEIEQRKEHIKLQKTRVYYPILLQAFKERRMQDVEAYSQKILEIAPDSTAALGRLRKLYNNRKQYDKLQTLYEQRLVLENGENAWAQVAMANATLRKAEKTGSAQDIAAVNAKLVTLEQYDLKSTKLNAAKCWIRVKSCITQKQYRNGRDEINRALEQLPVGSGLSTSLRLVYVDSYLRENRQLLAMLLLQAMVNKEANESQLAGDQMLGNLKRLWQSNAQPRLKKGRKQQALNKENIPIDTYYKLAQLYKKQGNQSALSDTLKKIQGAEPQSKFIRKMQRSS